MRHSSMKSSVAALTITVTVLAVAPAASARQAKDQRTQASARAESRDTDRFGAVRQFIQRTLRRIGINSGITIPVPAPSNPNED